LPKFSEYLSEIISQQLGRSLLEKLIVAQLGKECSAFYLKINYCVHKSLALGLSRGR
jgi:hypothetical protein